MLYCWWVHPSQGSHVLTGVLLDCLGRSLLLDKTGYLNDGKEAIVLVKTEHDAAMSCMAEARVACSEDAAKGLLCLRELPALKMLQMKLFCGEVEDDCP